MGDQVRDRPPIPLVPIPVHPDDPLADHPAATDQSAPVTVVVRQGRVVLNDLSLVVDRPEVKIIAGDARTKHAEMAAQAGSQACYEVAFGLTERSLYGEDGSPDWTIVEVRGLPGEDDEWLVEATVTGYSVTVYCWLKSRLRDAPLLWERPGRREGGSGDA